MENIEKFTIYHNIKSICSSMVRIYTLEKKLPNLHFHHIDLEKKENLEPFYMKINPLGLVPSLVIKYKNGEEKIVTDSKLLTYYIEEHFSDYNPLLLRGKEKNIKEVIEKIHDINFFPISFGIKETDPSLIKAKQVEIQNFFKIMTNYINQKISENPNMKEIYEKKIKLLKDTKTDLACDISFIELEWKKIESLLSELDFLLLNNKYLFSNNQITIADIHAIPLLARLTYLNEEKLINSRKHLLRWWNDMKQRKSYQVVFNIPCNIKSHLNDCCCK